MQHIAYQMPDRSRFAGRSSAASLVLLCICTCLPSVARSDDWMTWPSSYTHQPSYGQRVDQYAPPVQPVVQRDPSFQRSGYRHYRSTLQGGNSADNIHIVEQWGAPVVPYEQWRFPFRPYGSPYDAWGPQAPYGIINGNFNGNTGGNPGGNFGGNTGYPRPFPGQAAQPMPPHGYQPPAGANPHPAYPHPAYPNGNLPYDGYSNQGYPNPGYSPQSPSNGFPLSPPYQNQPWYDGNYPVAPPLDNRSDAEFFYTPRRSN